MASDKQERMLRLKLILMNAPSDGWKVDDLVRMSGIDYKNIHRDLNDIGSKKLDYARYAYEPTPDEIEYAKGILKAARKGKE